MRPGDRLTLTIERPAAGGRMIARHGGAIVLAAGAIPGEVVEATVEKIQRGTIWAVATTILEPSPDRVNVTADPSCGGNVLAYVRYERQLALKAAIVEDAMRRIGHITLDDSVDVVASPTDGYRMRARLHARHRRIGFFREATHAICDVAQTRQLRSDSVTIIERLAQGLATLPRETVSEIELSENVAAVERTCHLELLPDADPSRLATLIQIEGLTGVTCAAAGHHRTMELSGAPFVSDVVAGVTLSRHARSFFQGNRYLLAPLAEYVLSQITNGPVLDLYAGVGLFSLSAAAAGRGPIVAVEGDRYSAADLRRNAAAHPQVEVREESVERYLEIARARPATMVLDPPRTGLSKAALHGAIAQRAPRVVYVSCDIATLARDARTLVDNGYRIESVRAFDLFPNTAHVETIIAFAR